MLRRVDRAEEAAEHSAIPQKLVQQIAQCDQIRSQLVDDPHHLDLRCDLAELYLECAGEPDARLELQMILEEDPDFRRARDLLQDLADE